MKTVKVKLLVNTAYQGPRKEGDVVAVPEDFASRWVKNGIAQYVSGGEQLEEVPAEQVEEIVETEVDYSSMTAKELYALCKDKGLDVEAKKSKEYYIGQLTQ